MINVDYYSGCTDQGPCKRFRSFVEPNNLRHLEDLVKAELNNELQMGINKVKAERIPSGLGIKFTIEHQNDVNADKVKKVLRD